MSSSMVTESHVAAERLSQTSDQTLGHRTDTLCYSLLQAMQELYVALENGCLRSGTVHWIQCKT